MVKNLTKLSKVYKKNITYLKNLTDFTGAVKRWNFAGGRESHGHRMGRRVGSIGNCEWPGRVQPGKKMPGQYGNTNVSVKNEVISFDAETGILVLKGSVAGPNGALGKVKVAK